MSATPPGPPAGRTPNGGPPLIRRPKNADPLVRPKKNLHRSPRPPPTSEAISSSAKVNGKAGPGTGVRPSKEIGQKVKPLATSSSQTRPPTSSIAKADNNGFSGPRPTGWYHDYDLVTTKRAVSEGLRYHIARFASKKTVDPTNGEEFTRPVRLQRRDPRAPPAGPGGARMEDTDMADASSKEDIVDEKEREKQELLRLEKEAQKQVDLEKIAPRATQFGGANKKGAFNKKTTQVYDHDQTPEAQKRSQVRYEEALPWHLEDFDNKNTWVGNYESALSDMYVSLIGTPDTFNMVPLERWYKFTPKNQFKTLTIEEAETRMSKAMKEPRWIMDQQNALEQKKQQEAVNRTGGRKLFLGKWDNERGGRGPAASVKVDADADDIDFVEEVQDDEGPQIIEGEEEETKEAEARIKRDQLQANFFDLKEEKQYELEDAEEKKQAELMKKLGKGIKKALIDREKNYIYDSDSDANPYSDESDSGDADDEKTKEEERKKGEEKMDKSKLKDGGKSASGTSSKGNTTPSGRVKHTDALKKSTKNLKRPGSPDLSEASGTDSTRKKHKKKHGSSQPTGTSTPLPESRSGSPPPSSAPEGRVSKFSVDAAKLSEIAGGKRIKIRYGGGSGSEGEATGGEMSDDGQRPKKLKLRINAPSNGGSPTGSRAGSPNLSTGRPGAPPGSGSRAGSPTSGSPPGVKPVTEEELVASVATIDPQKGATISELLAMLGKSRVSLWPQGVFASMVKKHARLVSHKIPNSDKEEKRLYPKTKPAAPA